MVLAHKSARCVEIFSLFWTTRFTIKETGFFLPQYACWWMNRQVDHAVE